MTEHTLLMVVTVLLKFYISDSI